MAERLLINDTPVINSNAKRVPTFYNGSVPTKVDPVSAKMHVVKQQSVANVDYYKAGSRRFFVANLQSLR
jgi:hypothetical protein